jgi:hypothetical protein
MIDWTFAPLLEQVLMTLQTFFSMSKSSFNKLVDDKKMQKIVFEAKTAQNELFCCQDVNPSAMCLMPDIRVDPGLGKWKFQRAMVGNQKKYVKLQIGMLINGLNRTRIL